GAGDRGAAGVTHHLDTGLLRPADLGLAVGRVVEAAKAVFGQPDALGRDLLEVGRAEGRLDYDRAGLDLHTVRLEVLKAGPRGDGQRLEAARVLRPARGVDLAW